MEGPVPVGIDFGTYASKVAVVKGNVPCPLMFQGRATIPTLVAFRMGQDGQPEMVVGRDAQKLQLLGTPTVRSVKRCFGTGETFQHFDQEFTAPMVAAAVLRHIIKETCRTLGSKELKICATSPANWMPPQDTDMNAAYLSAIESLSQEGYIISVDDWIREPVAVALARRLGKQLPKGSKIVVLDPGGGTTDFCLIELTGETLLTVRAKTGITLFGGDDVDRHIGEYLLDKVLENSEAKSAHDSLDDQAKQGLIEKLAFAARNAKEAMITDNLKVAKINAPWLMVGESGPISFTGTISRDQFNKLAKPLIEQCREPVSRLLEEAKIEPSAVALVLTVGGTSLVDPFKQFVSGMFPGVRVLQEGNPITMCSQGAAMMASGKINLRDIVGYDYMAEVVDSKTKQPHYAVILPRSHPVGVDVKIRAKTSKAGQKRARIRILKVNDTPGMAPDQVAEFQLPVEAKPDRHGYIELVLNYGERLRIFPSVDGKPQRTIEARDVAEPDETMRQFAVEMLRTMERSVPSNGGNQSGRAAKRSEPIVTSATAGEISAHNEQLIAQQKSERRARREAQKKRRRDRRASDEEEE